MGQAARASNTCPLLKNEPFMAVTAITRSIDKIAISLIGADKDLKSLINMLKQAGFETVQAGFAKKSGYRRALKMFGFDGVTMIALYQSKRAFVPVARLEIHDSTNDFMEFLNSAIEHVHLRAKVSVAEIALDIQADKTYLLKDLIAAKLFLPYQRKPSGNYEDLTHYTTDIYRASKGHRLYCKTVQGKSVLRLELQLNRPVLKRLGITPANAHEALCELDLRPYIQFRHIDFPALARFYVKKHRKATKHQAIHDGLIKAQLRSYLIGNGQELMPQVEQLRRLEPGLNMSRFVVRDTEFEQQFFAYFEH